MGRQGLSRLGGDGGVVRSDLSLRHRMFQLMGGGVTSNGSKSCILQHLVCEDCALTCSTLFHCFIRVDGPVRILSLKELLDHDCTLGIQVEPSIKQ